MGVGELGQIITRNVLQLNLVLLSSSKISVKTDKERICKNVDLAVKIGEVINLIVDNFLLVHNINIWPDLACRYCRNKHN